MPSNLPSLPDVITGLASVLFKIKALAADLRAKFAGVTDAPAEFLDAVLPELEAAVGDPTYALSLATKVWADIQSGHAGYNKHHPGGA